MIKQIIPATGWAAIYEETDGSKKRVTALPLVCWATDIDSVFGMISNGDGLVGRADGRDGFKSYDYDYAEAETDYLIRNDDED